MLSCFGVHWQGLAVYSMAMLWKSCAYFVIALMQQVNGKIISGNRQ